MAPPQIIRSTEKLKFDMENFKRMRDEILINQDVNPDNMPLNIHEYAKHAFLNGTVQEKRELIKSVGTALYIKNGLVCASPVALQ